jgi:hypothetical protein
MQKQGLVKVGRNDPCPCGSGKKYKKCCLGKAAEAGDTNITSGVRSSREISRLLNEQQGLWIHPYVITKLAEEPEALHANPALARYVQTSKRVWTTRKVAALRTAEIEAGLRRLGVQYEADRFLQETEGHWSAWDLSDIWRERDGLSCEGSDDDFLGMAACELWKRMLPERPSMEMVDEQMQQGYDLVHADEEDQACTVWWQVWATLLARLPADVKSGLEADETFHGIQSVYNWMQDFENCLMTVAPGNEEWAQRGVQYCRERMARFTEDGPLLQVNVRRALSELLVETGQAAEALEVLTQTVQEWPDQLWAHVALADFHAGLFGPRNNWPVDVERALQILHDVPPAVGATSDGKHVLRERMAQYGRKRA